MQWSADRNAGFSHADTVALYLPPIVDPLFGHEAVNVELQQQVRSSLLNWIRWLIRVRNAHQAFGRGDIVFLPSENERLLAYTRCYGDEIILCVVNLSETAQAAELELSRYAGCVPVDLFGSSILPAVGEEPYPMMLPGHSFYWLKLLSENDARLRLREPLEARDRPELPRVLKARSPRLKG
jgi:maltose alpha-D-glucosyltransferase/alpha-amylase